MRRILSALLLLAALAVPARAQTWFKVATDPQWVTVSGVSWRFGSGTCWSPTSTAPINTWLSNLIPNGLVATDPCPGVVKELDILETPAVQTVTVANVAVTIPAALPQPTTLTITPNVSYTVSVMNIPPAGLASPLQGQLTIAIGSTTVSFVCTYGTTLSNTSAIPVAMQAVFNCVALPPAQ